MKKLTIPFLFTLLTISAQAQFGLKAGLNLSNATIKGGGIELDTKMRPTFHIGPTYEAGITDNLCINTSLLLSGRGYNYTFDTGILGKVEITNSLMYLQLPVLLSYKTEKFYIGAGPYAGLGIAGKSKSGDDSEDVKFGNSAEDDVSPLDFGANLEGGLIFNKFRVGVGYSLGLANTVPKDAQTDDFSSKNNAITIGLTYMFK